MFTLTKLCNLLKNNWLKIWWFKFFIVSLHPTTVVTALYTPKGPEGMYGLDVGL